MRTRNRRHQKAIKLENVRTQYGFKASGVFIIAYLDRLLDRFINESID